MRIKKRAQSHGTVTTDSEKGSKPGQLQMSSKDPKQLPCQEHQVVGSVGCSWKEGFKGDRFREPEL